MKIINANAYKCASVIAVKGSVHGNMRGDPLKK
jgi:hypothetical protein